MRGRGVSARVGVCVREGVGGKGFSVCVSVLRVCLYDVHLFLCKCASVSVSVRVCVREGVRGSDLSLCVSVLRICMSVCRIYISM